MKLLNFLLDLIKEIIAPKMCCHCGRFFTFLCDDCYEQIDFSFDTNYLQQKLVTNTQFLDRIITVGNFDGPLKSLVLGLKYQGQIEVAATLANLAYHTSLFPDCDLITAVPAHQKRIKDTGFSQSQLLAEHLAKLLKKPYVDLLHRNKKLTSQASISDKGERSKRQFHTMSAQKSQQLLHKTVLVVDDVFTTGATLNEAARVLKQDCLAEKVVGFAIAQA